MPIDKASSKSFVAPIHPIFRNPFWQELGRESHASYSTSASSDSESVYSTSSWNFDTDVDYSRRSSLTSNESGDSEKQLTLENSGVVYTIQGIIARGGFGEVLQAESSLGDQVAIKVCAKVVEGRSSKSVNDTIATEMGALRATTWKPQPFLTQPLASFQDANNVYFVMVSPYPSPLIFFTDGISPTEALSGEFRASCIRDGC